jgi:hypothetical protein
VITIPMEGGKRRKSVVKRVRAGQRACEVWTFRN